MARKAKEEVLINKQPIRINKNTAENKKSAVKSVEKNNIKSSSVTKTPSNKKEIKKVNNKNIDTKNVNLNSTSKTKSTNTSKTNKSSKNNITTKNAKSSETIKSNEIAKSSKTIKSSKNANTSKITKNSKPTKSTESTKTAKSSKSIKSNETAKPSKTTKTAKKVTTNKKGSSRKNSKNIFLNMPEYYDLPYRYNKTVVKVLAQNPNTLFVYWDISDEDRTNFENQYGNDFFSRTKPVLVIHNLTDNYTFEVEINDFANNWYVNVNDTKCKYFVELGRRPKNNDFINKPINYFNIAFSNTIEIPNDHILFFKENDKIYFKNIKTNKITEKVIKTHINNAQGIYKTYKLSKSNNRFDFKNPSSQNPTSSLLKI